MHVRHPLLFRLRSGAQAGKGGAAAQGGFSEGSCLCVGLPLPLTCEGQRAGAQTGRVASVSLRACLGRVCPPGRPPVPDQRRPCLAQRVHRPRGWQAVRWHHCPCSALSLSLYTLAPLQFLHNVSINLKDGGYFIGTVPDGKRVNACIKQ